MSAFSPAASASSRPQARERQVTRQGKSGDAELLVPVFDSASESKLTLSVQRFVPVRRHRTPGASPLRSPDQRLRMEHLLLGDSVLGRNEIAGVQRRCSPVARSPGGFHRRDRCCCHLSSPPALVLPRVWADGCVFRCVFDTPLPLSVLPLLVPLLHLLSHSQ